jgi:DNA-binding response OmpR family regulator
MPGSDILQGKRILIVDDEPDILETLSEILDMCLIDSAPSFETAKKFLDKYPYDAAIFDIMGVHGYDLLKIANEKSIPAIMLTAHALTPENLIKSIKEGAQSYIPKDKLYEIDIYLRELLESREEGVTKHGKWFARLKPFFDKKFGSGWREKDRKFWDEFDNLNYISKEELEDIL